MLQLIVTTGKVNSGLSLLAFGALFTWAWLELFDGVNYFRRLLGLLVLLLAIANSAIEPKTIPDPISAIIVTTVSSSTILVLLSAS
nr:hypothetical protein [Pseudanabaena sp. UWO310]